MISTQKIGIDIGYNSTVFHGKNHNGAFRSVVSPFNGGELDRSYREKHIIELDDGTAWYVGQTAVERGNPMFPDVNRGWVTTDGYYRLFIAALSLAVHQTAAVDIVTGLPIEYLANDRQSVVDTMIGEHTFSRVGKPTQTVTVNSVTVLPQGSGAFFGKLFPQSGGFDSDLMGSNVGIIDFGGKTTGFLTVKNGGMSAVHSASIAKGGLDVFRELKRILADSIPKSRSDFALIKDMENGYTKAYGRKVPLVDQTKRASGEAGGMIVSKATDLFTGGFDLDTIILCGGGVHLFGGYIKEAFPHSVVVTAEKPQMANAIGYYQFGVNNGQQ